MRRVTNFVLALTGSALAAFSIVGLVAERAYLPGSISPLYGPLLPDVALWAVLLGGVVLILTSLSFLADDDGHVRLPAFAVGASAAIAGLTLGARLAVVTERTVDGSTTSWTPLLLTVGVALLVTLASAAIRHHTAFARVLRHKTA